MSLKLRGSTSLIGCTRNVYESRIRKRVRSYFLFAVFAILMLAPVLGGQEPSGAVLEGVVHGSDGKAVSNAHVVLRGVDSQVTRETKTDLTGRFTFGDLATGAFTLTANSGSLRSTVAVKISTHNRQPLLNLVLTGSQENGAASARQDANQGMQLADNPDFSIAAVTDWTAAGGHGSDSSLRTSEALTREAVRLGPAKAPPATAAVRRGTGGEHEESESTLLDAAAKDPQGFEGNSRLGRFYIRAGRYKEALPVLQAAYQADPANYDNEYDLARALKMAGDAEQAREHVKRLLVRRPSADLHHMEGELDEKLGDPLSAVHEFQEAASKEPSEDNYFAWGSELLLHRAVLQAKEVFGEGTRLYPRSARMLTARGAALFANALYDQAALDLCKASDLDPQSEEPYLFMGKIEIASPNPLPCVVAKLERFEKLQPTNALASYYYSMALWKQQGPTRDPRVTERVRAMLAKAVSLDPKCSDAYLQLGNLGAGENQLDVAIGFYLKAIQANSESSEAHYRLGVAYERAGQKSKAREEFQLHDSIAEKQAAEIQRQRESVKQFLVVSPGQATNQQSH